MFENSKRDVVYFHAGLRPNEYYLAKAIKLDADRARDDLKVDRKALDRAAERLKAGRRPVRFDLSPNDFASRIEVLLSECQTLEDQQDKVQRGLADLYSKRTLLLEQSEIAGNALAELDADFDFMGSTPLPMPHMLPAPPKSSETRAIMFLVSRDFEHLRGWFR